jgi:kelch-like protein 2/3
VSVYEPATEQWDSLPLTSPRYWASAVGLNGLLYIMEGYSGNGPVVWAEVYNPATKTWRPLTDMPTRWSPSAGAINGKIYVIGGQGDVTLATNQAYTP